MCFTALSDDLAGRVAVKEGVEATYAKVALCRRIWTRTDGLNWALLRKYEDSDWKGEWEAHRASDCELATRALYEGVVIGLIQEGHEVESLLQDRATPEEVETHYAALPGYGSF